jgi:hypothetical protein
MTVTRLRWRAEPFLYRVASLRCRLSPRQAASPTHMQNAILPLYDATAYYAMPSVCLHTLRLPQTAALSLWVGRQTCPQPISWSAPATSPPSVRLSESLAVALLPMRVGAQDEILPILLTFCSVNQRLPSGPLVIPAGPQGCWLLQGVGRVNS